MPTPDPMSKIDWTLIQSFLAVLDHGSLSAAARALGLSQPTLGRHIAALETTLGATLFTRVQNGMTLTSEAAPLIAPARAMRQAAAELRVAAVGQDQSLAGSVTITASEIIAQYFLPGILADLRRQTPEIQIEIVASNDSQNLLFGEADIAIRMFRPTQLDLIARHIGDLAVVAYGAKSYLDRHGYPAAIQDFAGHTIVGYAKSRRIIDGMAQFGMQATRNDFAMRSDNQTVYHEMIRAGGGIGFGLAALVARDPELVALAPDIPVPPLPLWICAPAQMRQTPRMDRVWRHLDAHLSTLVS